MIPNTPIVARWRVYPAGHRRRAGRRPGDQGRLRRRPVRLEDRDRATLVRVHWYEGDAAFGAKALKLGEDEVRDDVEAARRDRDRAGRLLRLRQQSTTSTARSGPGAHENVAGTAYANIRTLLGLIPPDQIDDPLVAVRIPHEFVHLVFDTAVEEPVPQPAALAQRGPGGLPERGLRVVATAARSRTAARYGTLIPLDGLTGQFPNGQDFFLAYSESVGAVDFMIRTYGKRRARHADPLVRRRADGRRGVQRRARARHDGVRRRLVQGREREAADEVRPAAGAARPGARGLGRRGAGRRRRAGRAGAGGAARRARRVGDRPQRAASPAVIGGRRVGILVARDRRVVVVVAVGLCVARRSPARRRTPLP